MGYLDGLLGGLYGLFGRWDGLEGVVWRALWAVRRGC